MNNGVDTEFFHIGNKPVRGCIACGRCEELGRCTFDDDVCNEMAERMAGADGIVVASQYWNMVHGFTPDDVRKDLEGMQIMRTLGNNMAWMLNSIRDGKQLAPEREPWIMTNFIR